ncbi:MAG TPA: FtsW/RodA/SpoVE family cell cycle protein, partial [Nitrolancea sp.]|nr:FtsW/RodA/SpoVE family cell cycle protein [Nitrolancea sp.]
MIASARSAGQSLVTALSGSGASGKRKIHAPDFWLIALILTLVMFGIVMVFSASFAIGIQEDGNSYFFVTRQAIWAVIGLTGMTVTALIDYHFWRRFSLPGLILIMLMLAALVFVPGLGSGGDSWGAKRWIDFGPLSFQPSEVAKVVLVIYLADWLGQKGK